jgi:hypothetical protein
MDKALQIYRINTPGEFEKSGLEGIAQAAGKALAPPYPVFAVFLDGRPRAAFHIDRRAILYPALDLTPVSPREFYRLCKHVLEVYRSNFPGGLVASDLQYPADTVTPEKLVKVGLTPFDHRLYEISDP